jgi:Trk K+ transport system NAD-binding subunit
MIPARRVLRKLRASWRDTLLLLREFRWPLLWFVLTILGSGFLYYSLAQAVGRPLSSLGEAFYHTLTLAFLQPTIDFPPEWFLQIFYFLLPLIGVGILAHGLADFGILFFNRRARGKEWEMAVASTMNNHVILIGLGHLGYRVVKKLRDLDQDVVVIEKSPEPDLLHSIRDMDVPVIEDDGTRETVLKAAGAARARAIILCTQNDSLNLRMALKARNVNPKIEVVIRIFDDEFAESLEKQFGFHAMSATGMAAPLFASIAAQIHITPPVLIGGQPQMVANLVIDSHSHLAAKTILTIEEKYQIAIILLCKDDRRIFHPAAEEIVAVGDTIAIFGDPEKIHQIVHENHR